MTGAQFPASAARSLIEGYCDEFFSLATLLAETLDQASTRDLDIGSSSTELERLKNGMRELTEAIELSLGSAAGDTSPTTPHGTAVILDNSPPPPKPQRSARLALATSPFADQPVKQPAPDEDAPGPVAPALKGSNRSMPMRSVFQFVERVRKSGIMTVQLPDETLTFEFDNGYVQACRTTNRTKGDRLGDLLRDTCDTTLLNNLLRRAKAHTNQQIGEMVVRAGLTTNGMVLNALEEQVRGRFQRACEAAEATYEFLDRPANRSDGRIRIAPMELSHKSKI